MSQTPSEKEKTKTKKIAKPEEETLPSTSRQAEANTDSNLPRKSSKSKLTQDTDDVEKKSKKQRTISTPVEKQNTLDSDSVTPKVETKKRTRSKSLSKRKPQTNSISWGNLYFYENQNMILNFELSDNEPIKITGQSILGLAEVKDTDKNVLSKYNDWQHAIGKGFTLKKNADKMNVIEMASLDDSPNANKYKVIVGDEEMVVKSSNFFKLIFYFFINIFWFFFKAEVYTIYDPDDQMKDIGLVKNLESAHSFVHSCYALIGIHGKFMSSVPIPLTIDRINKSIMPSLPYWFILKFNPEYAILDEHINHIIN